MISAGREDIKSIFNLEDASETISWSWGIESLGIRLEKYSIILQMSLHSFLESTIFVNIYENGVVWKSSTIMEYLDTIQIGDPLLVIV
ncbi:hypothetical protein O9G_001883 [Rozella allomycis CSF55]|uniref:Uncharacterized protein n=1 Tax=Rozella allomycis (strain CSF55) TaxID=988480 RepID=A0A075AWJ0_ROZAC|nr:hypothetical protein O9G_001883 [Rozella allomycis CSF55]|eukprot:EPZ34582.1 hypothetical protein O9G_001883 [Rozella allomycis CSF55]